MSEVRTVLTPSELACRARITAHRIREKAALGEIPDAEPTGDGRRWQFPLTDDLRAWICFYRVRNELLQIPRSVARDQLRRAWGSDWRQARATLDLFRQPVMQLAVAAGGGRGTCLLGPNLTCDGVEIVVLEVGLMTNVLGQHPTTGAGYRMTATRSSGAKQRPIKITSAGIEFVGRAEWAEYSAFLAAWSQVKQAYPLHLADIVGHGLKTFGGTKIEALLAQLECSRSEAIRALRMSRISSEVRSLGLTAAHYYVLGQLLDGNERAQTKWATKAVRNELSASELRKSIEGGGEMIRKSQLQRLSGRDSGIPNIEGHSVWYDRWRKKVGGRAAMLAWDERLKRRWLEQVAGIVEDAAAIKGSLRE